MRSWEERKQRRAKVEILKRHIVENCSRIKRVGKRSVTFESHFACQEGFGYLCENEDLYRIACEIGMFKIGGDNVLHFKK